LAILLPAGVLDSTSVDEVELFTAVDIDAVAIVSDSFFFVFLKIILVVDSLSRTGRVELLVDS